MDIEFEWDPQKSIWNLKKHSVSFHEAATLFADLLSITVADPDHSSEEDRYLIVGLSKRGKLLIVSHVDRNHRIRIISARELNRAEREAYETGNFP